MVRRHQCDYRKEPSRFPLDFPERLEHFMEAADCPREPLPDCCGWTTGRFVAGARGRVRGRWRTPTSRGALEDGAFHSSVSKERDCTNDGEPD
ncbi:MAG: hypothetical protein OXD46_10495 [Chloroflexi bacterium]|nr:hypothetical protein [Chloroflexota bacterium]